MKKSLICVLLSIALCVACLVTSSANEEISDVSESSYLYPYICYVVEKGYVDLTGDSSYSPKVYMTRAMFVMGLYRLSRDYGLYDNFESGYEDVSADDWYGGAVAWAREMGITADLEGNAFCPGKAITREVIACFVHRFLEAYDLISEEDEEVELSYTDLDQVSQWALEGLEAATRAGILSGNKNGKFRPQDAATRGECAIVLTKLDQLANG